MSEKKQNWEYVPRLSVEIREDQLQSMQKLIPFGFRKLLFQRLIDDVLKVTEDHGQVGLSAICTGAIGVGYNKLQEYIEKSSAKKEKKDDQ